MTTIAENENNFAIITNNLDFSTPRKQQADHQDEGFLRQTFDNPTIDQSLEPFTYQRPEFSPVTANIEEQSPLSSVQQAHVYSSAFETPAYTPSFYDQTPVITNRNPSIDSSPNNFEIINKPSNYY